MICQCLPCSISSAEFYHNLGRRGVCKELRYGGFVCILHKLQFLIGREMENRVAHDLVDDKRKTEKVPGLPDYPSRAVPNVGVGWTMRGIPLRELAIFAETARKRHAKEVVFDALRSTEHTLLGNARVNRECCAYP